MAGKTLTITLTEDQQRQIKNATGKTVSKLHIDLDSTGGLTDKELDQVSGGTTFLKYELKNVYVSK